MTSFPLSKPSLPTDLSKGIFVTGTDTGIGKTLVSAVLATAWNATYWKPLQTGLEEEEGDTATVKALANLPSERIITPTYTLQSPLAPSAAAEREGITISFKNLALPKRTSPLVVEGAGGLLVPITRSMMMIDLIIHLGLPVILVTRSGLGTINHTLLSLEALYRRNIPVLGFISNGERNNDNQHRIEELGQIRCLAHIDPISSITRESVKFYADLIPKLSHDMNW